MKNSTLFILAIILIFAGRYIHGFLIIVGIVLFLIALLRAFIKWFTSPIEITITKVKKDKK